MVEVWWLRVMFEPVRFIVFVPLSSRDKKVNTFSKFHPNYTIAGIQQLQCCHVEMTWNQRKLINEHWKSVWWERNGFAEVAGFCLMACRYFNIFLPQGVDKNQCQARFLYLAPGLTCEGYWQVNFWRSIFCIVDPNVLYTCEPNYLNATTCAPQAMPSYSYNYVMIVTINIQIHFH